MDKSSWINAFVLRLTALGTTRREPAKLAEQLFPHVGKLDPAWVAKAEHAMGDSELEISPATDRYEADCARRSDD
jgi:hypothetical protein